MNEADQDRDLDARLRAAFAPPSAATFAAAATRAAHGRAPRRWPWWAATAAAAALVLALFLASAPRRGPEGHDGRTLGAMWAAAYHDAVARGFSQRSCCQGDFDLAADCERVFARPLELAAATDLAVLGEYCGLSTGGCMAMLARRGDEPVQVCIVRTAQDPRVELPPDCGLRLARRELDGLVIYALAPDSPQRALEQFVLPER